MNTLKLLLSLCMYIGISLSTYAQEMTHFNIYIPPIPDGQLIYFIPKKYPVELSTPSREATADYYFLKQREYIQRVDHYFGEAFPDYSEWPFLKRISVFIDFTKDGEILRIQLATSKKYTEDVLKNEKKLLQYTQLIENIPLTEYVKIEKPEKFERGMLGFPLINTGRINLNVEGSQLKK